MPSYNCPYCNYPITKENVLFQYRSQKLPYQDARRFAYYHLCASNWTLDSDKFEGLYFFVEDAADGEVTLDANGFPLKINVRPFEGKTPAELESMEIPGRRLDDFITQYYNTNPYEMQRPVTTPKIQEDDFFSPSVFGGQETQAAQQDANAEIKPADDGTVVPLSTRVCPNCHNELHTRFGLIDTINVTLLGGPSAGKTAYLLSLVHQLPVQLSAKRLGTAVLLDASQRYYDYLNAGFQNLKTTMPTPGQEKLFPFIFHYRNDRKECFVKFSDIAGETTTQADELLKHSGTMEATNLMLLLDPNQLNQGLYFAIKNQGASDGGNIHSFNTDITTFLTKSIATHVGLGAFRNIKNVFAVFSKMDMVLEKDPKKFGAGSADSNCRIRYDLGQDHQDGLDYSVIQTIQAQMHRFINDALGQKNFDLLGMIRNLFPADQNINMWLLGVSTQTLVDANNIVFENRCYETASKHRIIEPFLCILAQNGMIPVIGLPTPTKPPKPPKPPKPSKKRGLFGKK